MRSVWFLGLVAVLVVSCVSVSRRGREVVVPRECVVFRESTRDAEIRSLATGLALAFRQKAQEARLSGDAGIAESAENGAVVVDMLVGKGLRWQDRLLPMPWEIESKTTQSSD